MLHGLSLLSCEHPILPYQMGLFNKPLRPEQGQSRLITADSLLSDNVDFVILIIAYSHFSNIHSLALSDFNNIGFSNVPILILAK